MSIKDKHMKRYKITIPIMLTALTFSLSGCMDEVTPLSTITQEQVEALSSSQEASLNGLVAFTNDLNTWGATGDEAYYLNDWGYPCQMFLRDILTADIPTASSNYNYWIYPEQSTELRYVPYYTYNYYYHYVKNCNSLISSIDPTTASETSLHYLGCALVFRAMCYLDMARMFEYQPTGYTSLDSKATEVLGLTVPIVTETTTEEDMKHNPRAPFYTMYKFILTDLTNAVKYLDGYKRSDESYPDQSVAYGFLARLWLEVATRFDLTPADLSTAISHDSDADGYQPLGISSAVECYEKAKEYADKLINGFSYTPMTQSEWTDPSTGFNTATSAWIFASTLSTKEQTGNYYSNFQGTICTEASWGMAQYGPYRCIGSWLYDQIGDNDWRKLSWIAPEDAGKAPDEKYRAAEWSTTVSNTVITSSEKFKSYPAYANLKFRARNNIDNYEGMYCDLPLMRIEEMYFIDAEATAHIDGPASGAAKLASFMNSYRYNGGGYTCNATTIDDFNEEMMKQKRVEFWGEGIILFDMKRLKMPVLRSLNTNYLEAYLQDSKSGYVCPSMNYFILEYAANTNDQMVLNPDCSGWYDKE